MCAVWRVGGGPARCVLLGAWVVDPRGIRSAGCGRCLVGWVWAVAAWCLVGWVWAVAAWCLVGWVWAVAAWCLVGWVWAVAGRCPAGWVCAAGPGGVAVPGA